LWPRPSRSVLQCPSALQCPLGAFVDTTEINTAAGGGTGTYLYERAKCDVCEDGGAALQYM
jgi:hypothetical protein